MDGTMEEITKYMSVCVCVSVCMQIVRRKGICFLKKSIRCVCFVQFVLSFLCKFYVIFSVFLSFFASFVRRLQSGYLSLFDDFALHTIFASWWHTKMCVRFFRYLLRIFGILGHIHFINFCFCCTSNTYFLLQFLLCPFRQQFYGFDAFKVKGTSSLFCISIVEQNSIFSLSFREKPQILTSECYRWGISNLLRL